MALVERVAVLTPTPSPADTRDVSHPRGSSSQTPGQARRCSRCAPSADTTDFARLVAHEIRNLLTPVRARAQIALESEPTADDLARLAQRFIEVSDRIGAVTDAILDRSAIVPEPTDLAAAAREAAALTGASRSAGGCTITVADEAGSIPPLATSRVAVRHILVNLLLNALAASRQGVEVVIERSTWNTPTGAPAVAVTVRDTGLGLPADVLRSLRLDPDDQPQPARPATGDTAGVGSGIGVGAGVGIEVVRLLCERIGATVQARNNPGGGAAITVVIPDLAQSRTRAALTSATPGSAAA